VKRGPKPLSKSKLRRHALLVRINDGELAAIRAAAGSLGLATWLREAGLRAARRRQ